MGIRQQAVLGIALIHLNHVAVPAGCQQVFAVGRDVEVARMDACRLVAHGYQCAVRLHGENGNAVFLQPVAGVEEAAVGAQVYVGAAPCRSLVGHDALLLLQLAIGGVAEYGDFAGQFADEVGMPAVGAERQVPWPRVGLDAESRVGGLQAPPVGTDREA